MSSATSAAEVARTQPETEARIAEALDRIVVEGVPRLRAPWSSLLATGAVAGIEVSLGVLALLAVQHQTSNALLAGLAFSFGFVALLLGHSELFTEGFLVPIAVVAAGHATVRDVTRFWTATLIANLAGGWVATWLAIRAFPDLHATAVEAAKFFVDTGIGLRSFCLAVLAGAAITLMTRMISGTEAMSGKLAASVFTAFILAGLRLSHSVLESLLIFAALHTGHASFGYLDWLGWFGWTAFGNIVGGVGLVTVLRLVRSRSMLQRYREQVTDDALG